MVIYAILFLWYCFYNYHASILCSMVFFLCSSCNNYMHTDEFLCYTESFRYNFLLVWMDQIFYIINCNLNPLFKLVYTNLTLVETFLDVNIIYYNFKRHNLFVISTLIYLFSNIIVLLFPFWLFLITFFSVTACLIYKFLETCAHFVYGSILIGKVELTVDSFFLFNFNY